MTTTQYSKGIYTDKSGPSGEAAAITATVVIDLTEREMKVIQMIADGLYNKEIAWILKLSPFSTRLLISNLYLKLGVRGNARNRVGLVRLAIRKGWVKA